MEFPEAFREAVCAHPEQLAVDDWSYQRLDRRSNQYAWALKEQGVGPEQLVVLEMERSPEQLAALVGILKAGAAYLPLDPQGPPERRQRILQQAAGAVLMPSPSENSSSVELVTVPEHLAYVLFTSGSTGLPKGAMIEHRSLSNHLRSKVQDLGLRPGITVAQTAEASFDISVWQMLAALTAGARNLVVDRQVQLDSSAFLELLRRERVHVLELVPSHLQLLRQSTGELPHLRYLMPTGEALTAELARQLLQRFAGVTLVNAYGPTECCDDVLLHFFRDAPVDFVPLGQPLPGVQVFLLDPEGLEVVDEGEICVGGVCLGRGYLNDPQATARSFVHHPGLGRLYRTGDRARWEHGQLRFLGRQDQQVKVRGVRIELAEVEEALSACPGVQQAAVLYRHGRLQAFVGPVGVDPVCLAQKLPAAAIPSRIEVRPSLPLNAHGKIDRRALEESCSRPVQPPRTALELQLCGLFAEVLGLTEVGIEESFFELGGHSVTALRLLAAIDGLGHARLSPTDLLQAPSVERLAARLEGRSSPQAAVQLKAGTGPTIHLFPGAGGNLFYLHELVKQLPGPVIGYPARGLDGEAPPFASIEEAADSYFPHLTGSGAILMGHSIGAWTAFELALRLEAEGRPPQAVVLLDMPAPLPRPQEEWNDDGWVPALSEMFAAFYARELPQIAGSPAEQLEQAAAWLVAEGLFPESGARQRLVALLEVYRSHQLLRYVPLQRYSGRLHLIRRLPWIYSPHWGWEHFSRLPVEVSVVDGDHLTLLRPPLLQDVLQKLRPILRN